MSKEVLFHGVRCSSLTEWYREHRRDSMTALDQFLAPGRTLAEADPIIAAVLNIAPTRWSAVRSGKKHLGSETRPALDAVVEELTRQVAALEDDTRRELRRELLAQLNPASLFRNETAEAELEQLLAGVSRSLSALPAGISVRPVSMTSPGLTEPVLIGAVTQQDDRIVATTHGIPPFAQTLGAYGPDGMLLRVEHEMGT